MRWLQLDPGLRDQSAETALAMARFNARARLDQIDLTSLTGCEVVYNTPDIPDGVR